MSLGSTLLKVAIGIALAKGVSTLSKKGLGGGQATAPGTGTRYGGEKSTGLEDIFSDAIGKKTAQPTPQAGTGNSIDDFLGNLTGNSGQTPRTTTRANAPSGGLEDILGGLLGGKAPGGATTGGAAGGSLGDLLGGLLGGNPGSGQVLPEPGTIGGGTASNDAMAQGRAKGPMRSTTRDQDLAAALVLRAMVQAAKCDGDLDAGEKTKLFKNMGDASPDEIAFVKAELERPVDIDGLARQVPNGMEDQVYAMSLMAINLDSQTEAQYLHKLATALELDQNTVNALHDKAGAPRLYR
jgi:uncharacterized membrane protein YebE (DUF533 family)